MDAHSKGKVLEVRDTAEACPVVILLTIVICSMFFTEESSEDAIVLKVDDEGKLWPMSVIIEHASLLHPSFCR